MVAIRRRRVAEADTAENATGAAAAAAQARTNRRALRATKAQMQKAAVKLVGYLVGAYLILKLIPGLEQALSTLEHVTWRWVVLALALETVSEMGFTLSWTAIVDPEGVLSGDGRDKRMDTHVAWAQLGGGTLVPGGSLGGVGVGAWMLHRFGMPNKLVAERQFNLSFLNTGVDALALIVFGLALAIGVFSGARNLNLTLLPACVAAIGVTAATLIARRESVARRRRRDIKHPKVAAAITTLADAVDDTQRLLFHRGAGSKAVLGALAYLGFDVLVLWSAFLAIGTHPTPSFAVVLMAYIIGALGGSLPLPAGLGSIGGMVGMLILYGVPHEAAVAAVVMYQAVGMLVPLVGGGVAYMFVRRTLADTASPDRADPSGSEEPSAGPVARASGGGNPFPEA